MVEFKLEEEVDNDEADEEWKEGTGEVTGREAVIGEEIGGFEELIGKDLEEDFLEQGNSEILSFLK